MFERYLLGSKTKNIIWEQDITDIKTNPELVYVFDDLFPEALLQSMQDYDFQSLDWKPRTGSTEWHVFEPDSIIRPAFLITTKKYIEKKLRTSSPSTTISTVATEFMFCSRNTGLFGQCIHFDVFEAGPFWTSIIHLKGEGGNTIIYEDFNSEKVLTEVEFKPGRVILFPSLYPHRGMLPPSGNPRYSFNSVFKIVNFDCNEHILDLSSLRLKEKFQSKMLK
jgi:hypothetical protein